MVSRHGVLDRRATEAAARKKLAFLGADLDGSKLVGDLTLAERAFVQIGRALAEPARASSCSTNRRPPSVATKPGRWSPRSSPSPPTASASSTSRTGSKRCMTLPTRSSSCATVSRVVRSFEGSRFRQACRRLGDGRRTSVGGRPAAAVRRARRASRHRPWRPQPRRFQRRGPGRRDRRRLRRARFRARRSSPAASSAPTASRAAP